MARAAKKPKVDPAHTRELLAAILADPDDDAARAVMADHLIAAGDPRGEFIAVQLELARRGDKTEREDPATKPLWEKFRELHSRHSGKWLKPVKALGKKSVAWQLHRGFVRQVHARYEATPELLAALFAVEPVVDLAIDTYSTPHLEAMLDVPGIERIRRLVVFGYDGARDGSFIPAVLARANRIAGVSELRVGVNLHDAGLDALAKLELPALRHLLVGAAGGAPATVERFLKSPLAQNLTKLEWCRDRVGPIADAIVAMTNLEAFACSSGEADEAEQAFRKRFGKRFVLEEQPSFDYIYNSTL